MSKFSAIVSGLILLSGLSVPAIAKDGPDDLSGIAPFHDRTMVTVCDAKAKSEKPRLHLVTLSAKGASYIPVEIEYWSPDHQEEVQRASDLEAICQVPGKAGSFYAFESGYWKGGSGRAFEIAIHHDPERGWVGDVVRVFHPFAKPADGTTAGHLQIEGATAFQDGAGQQYLFLGLRGDENNAGQLVIEKLTDGEVSETERHSIDLHDLVPEGRSCSELMLLQSADNEYSIICSGCVDSSDVGPFTSTVCDLGTVEILENGYRLSLKEKPVELAHIDGFKVESLTIVYDDQGRRYICVGTDDESFAPIFRLLPRKED